MGDGLELHVYGKCDLTLDKKGNRCVHVERKLIDWKRENSMRSLNEGII